MDTEIKIAQVERHLNDSLLIISQQMSQINESLLKIAEGVTAQDVILGALRYLMVEKGIVADEEVERKAKELVALINQKQQAKKKPPQPFTVEGEVAKMGMEFAKSDSKEHPPEAFFFGGK